MNENTPFNLTDHFFDFGPDIQNETDPDDKNLLIYENFCAFLHSHLNQTTKNIIINAAPPSHNVANLFVVALKNIAQAKNMPVNIAVNNLSNKHQLDWEKYFKEAGIPITLSLQVFQVKPLRRLSAEEFAILYLQNQLEFDDKKIENEKQNLIFLFKNSLSAIQITNLNALILSSEVMHIENSNNEDPAYLFYCNLFNKFYENTSTMSTIVLNGTIKDDSLRKSFVYALRVTMNGFELNPQIDFDKSLDDDSLNEWITTFRHFDPYCMLNPILKKKLATACFTNLFSKLNYQPDKTVYEGMMDGVEKILKEPQVSPQANENAPSSPRNRG